jgi:nitrogenase subunit NifH
MNTIRTELVAAIAHNMLIEELIKQDKGVMLMWQVDQNGDEHYTKDAQDALNELQGVIDSSFTMAELRDMAKEVTHHD